MNKSNERSISDIHNQIINKKIDNLEKLPEIVGSENRPINEEVDFKLTADEIKFYLYEFSSADKESLTEDEQLLQTSINKRIKVTLISSLLIAALLTIPILFINLNIIVVSIISILAFISFRIISAGIIGEKLIQSAIDNEINNAFTHILPDQMALEAKQISEHNENTATKFIYNLSSKVSAANQEEFTKNYLQAIDLEVEGNFLENALSKEPNHPDLIKNIFHAGRSTDIIDAIFIPQEDPLEDESDDYNSYSLMHEDLFDKFKSHFESLDETFQLEIFIHNPIVIVHFDQIDAMYKALSRAFEQNTDLIKKLDYDSAKELMGICEKYEFVQDYEIENKVSDRISDVRNSRSFSR